MNDKNELIGYIMYYFFSFHFSKGRLKWFLTLLPSDIQNSLR